LNKRATLACELNKLRLYKIVQGLLWISEGKSLEKVARLLRVDVKTVWNWLKRLMVQGLSGLWGLDSRGRGRKSKLSGEQK
jgi:transposase